MSYEYTDDMREISGFGGGYEESCRAMVLAGLAWFEANPFAKPEFQGCEGICGVIKDNNTDAKGLSDAVIAACEEGATGAMHQASISHIMAIRDMGWDAYAEKMREMKREQLAAKE